MAKNINQVYALNPATSFNGTDLLYLGQGASDSAIQASDIFNTTNLQLSAGKLNTIQNITTGSSPTFVNITFSSTTASRLLATDGSKALSSVANLASWVAGTADQITVTNDGDGSITLAAAQNIATTSNVTFQDMKLNGLTASRLMATDGGKQVQSVSTLTSWIAGTANQVTVTDDLDGSVTLSLPQSINTGATVVFSILRTGDGDVSAPGWSFSGDTDTGFYRSASNTIDLATGGVNRATVSTTTITLNLTTNMLGTRMLVGTTTNTGSIKFQVSSATDADGVLALCTNTNSSTSGGGLYLTQNSASTVTSGSRVGTVFFGGLSDTGVVTFGSSRISCFATEAWSASAIGSRLDFFTTNNGATSATLKMRIDNDGTITLGASSSTPQHIINGATNTSANAGGASALPALPQGYWTITFNGTQRKIPYYVT